MKRILKGMDGHPGLWPLAALVLMGAAAGGLGGAGIMLAIFGPIVVFSAWERGKTKPQPRSPRGGITC